MESQIFATVFWKQVDFWSEGKSWATNKSLYFVLQQRFEMKSKKTFSVSNEINVYMIVNGNIVTLFLKKKINMKNHHNHLLCTGSNLFVAWSIDFL